MMATDSKHVSMTVYLDRKELVGSPRGVAAGHGAAHKVGMPDELWWVCLGRWL
jgi:hypothetical protein